MTYVCSSVLVLLNVHDRYQELCEYDASVREEERVENEKMGTAFPEPGDASSWDGLRFVWHNGVIRAIAFSAGQFNFFTAAFFTVYYVFVVRELHMDAVAVGVAASCSGIAGIVGASVASPLMRRVNPGPLFIWSLFGPAGASVLVPLASWCKDIHVLVILLVCLSQFCWSFMVTINVVLSESIKQIVTPKRLLGQVSSVERMLALCAEPIGALCGGWIADVIGDGWTLYGCAIGLVTSILWAMGQCGICSFRRPAEW